jgi:hypothetical protein
LPILSILPFFLFFSSIFYFFPKQKKSFGPSPGKCSGWPGHKTAPGPDYGPSLRGKKKTLARIFEKKKLVGSSYVVSFLLK